MIIKQTDSGIIKKIGYPKDQRGIMQRYLREQERWKSHLTNSKRFIVNCMENKTKDIAIVLGSGWLLDIPMDELAEKFHKVVLVDMVHPAEIIHKLKKYQNVTALPCDINGNAATVLQNVVTCFVNKGIKTPVEDIFFDVSPIRTLTENAGFVASVNLLNQLDILLVDYIGSFHIYQKTELSHIRKKLQDNHIQILPLGKTCLISDVVEVLTNDAGIEQERNTLIFTELPYSETKEQWQWDFDFSKHYNSKFNTHFIVQALGF